MASPPPAYSDEDDGAPPPYSEHVEQGPVWSNFIVQDTNNQQPPHTQTITRVQRSRTPDQQHPARIQPVVRENHNRAPDQQLPHTQPVTRIRRSRVPDQSAQAQPAVGIQNNTGAPAVQERIRVYTYTSEVTFSEYLANPLDAISTNINFINSFKGFVGILHEQRRLPWKFRLQVAYKLNLLLYYFVNFIYQIVACTVEGENIGYYVTFIIISFLGLVCETCEIIHYQCTVWNGNQLGAQIVDTNRREAWSEAQTNPSTQIRFEIKTRSVLMEYILHSIGEFLLLPSLICSLYGFINERSWTFDNGVAGFNFLLFVYSIGMDAFYVKFYFIWLVQKVIRMSHNKYINLQDESDNSRIRYCSPVYMTVLFTISMTILQWTTLAIIGVRVYADNFAASKSHSEPDKGNYISTSYTRFMISCSIYLPIVSWIAYLAINKYWFYQVYAFIKQFSDREVRIQSISVWVKFTSFVVDPVAYISAITLMLSFIAFTVGIFLPDYDSAKYDIQSAKIMSRILGILYITVFLLSNCQAAIVFGVVVVVIVVILVIVSVVLAVVLAIAAIIIAVAIVCGSLIVLGLMCYGLTMCCDS